MLAIFRVKLSCSFLNLATQSALYSGWKNAFGIIARQIKNSVTVQYFCLHLSK